MNKVHKVGIVGAGLIGKIRAQTIQKSNSSEVIGIVDIDKSKAEYLANEVNCVAFESIDALFTLKPDIVIICTPTKYHPDICLESFYKGAHVLCEKPLSKNVKESKEMVQASRSYKNILKTGFNHRHLPNIQKALEWINKGEIGDIMNIRSRYGHGGRKNYEKEWQAFPDIAGGGELLSQGVLILDLFIWFLG